MFTTSRSRSIMDCFCDAIHSVISASGVAGMVFLSWPTRGLEIADTLHAGGGHCGEGGIERARQVDGPASGLDKHGVEAEPARVNRGVMHAEIGGEASQENATQPAPA